MSAYLRRRSRTDLTRVSNVAQSFTSSGGLINTIPYSRDLMSHQTEMFDVVHPVIKPGDTNIHPVDQVRVVTSCSSWPNPLPHSAGWTIRFDGPTLETVDYGSAVALLPSPSSSILAGLSDEIYEDFFTQVPETVSIANFLYELREISGLIPQIQSSLAKTVSGGFLSFQFGWKPILGDLESLGSLVTDVRKRILYLKQTRGKKTRLHFQKKNLLSSSSGDVNVPETAWNKSTSVIGGHYRLRPLDYSDVFNAGGWLIHWLERLDGLEGELRALSAALGLLNPAKVAWETIPYSFVADWFTRTKGSIDQLDIANPYPGGWNVYGTSHSLKQRMTFRVDRIVDAGYQPSSWYVGIGTVERYQRWVGLPVSSSLLTRDSLDTRQQLLALALLGAR